MEIKLWDSGSTTAYVGGEQEPVAQKSWLILYAEYLEFMGINPIAQNIELPNGQKVTFFKTEDGYNWK